ncbi:alpha/beta hydrolase family protein [Streptacidiphilus cavernicola]|uniref:Alpha/beta family hydrolase n=1 Tax=Streptacidiphilus cavernicola TaxID=3342716 RepID=A0ABV6VS13_9ACTN
MHTLVSTPAGEARYTLFPAFPAFPATKGARTPPRALLALGHGAGGGIEAADLRALAAALPPLGITVALVEQPWRVAGKKLAPAPKTLDAGWLPVVAALRAAHPAGLPLLVGGRSAGARVACRTAVATGAAGVLALAFPLHPPGKPERSRAAELLDCPVPTLVVQGAKDPFGGGDAFPPLGAHQRLLALPYGNHSFAVLKSAPMSETELLALITDGVGEWATELLSGR